MELIDGVKIGNVDNGRTGVTAIVFENGCVCGCDVRGGAPGTRETALLSNDKANEHVDCVMLCGGSAFGLEATVGAMKALLVLNKGVKVADKVVPIVPAAVIFDLSGELSYPTSEMGYEAVMNAKSEVFSGKVGAGKGASVGKLLGFEHCSPSGLGIAKVKVGEISVIAAVVVNAFGDVIKNGRIIAGARGKDGFIDTANALSFADPAFKDANTTIGCIITDAKLSKVQANKLASIGHNGLAKAISPVHTEFDGDTLFCASAGDKEMDMLALEVACVSAVEQAIYNAVTL